MIHLDAAQPSTLAVPVVPSQGGAKATSPLRARGEHVDDVPFEADEMVELTDKNAFLVAVRTESLEPVFDVESRSDAVTLNPLVTEVGHVK
jgi:hypothetical protein